jgi:hypothetical protein
MGSKGAKIATDGLKDAGLQFKNLATDIKRLNEAVAFENVLTFAAIAGPLGGIISVILSVYIHNTEKNEVKAAIKDLSKELELLSAHIDDSINKVIAHQSQMQYQNHVSLPAKVLREKFMDFLQSGNNEDKKRLNQECKTTKPLNVFDKMEKLLNDDWKNILESNKYSDQSFATLKKLYENTAKELAPLYYVCESLAFDQNLKDPSSEEFETKAQHRTKKLTGRIEKFIQIFQQIDSDRVNLVWKESIPKLITVWHGELRKLRKNLKLSLATKIQHQLNTEFPNTGYHYLAGIMKAKANKYMNYFGCANESCLHKEENNMTIFVLRHKTCQNDYAASCIHFQKRLYNTYDNNHAVNQYDVKNITETFKRNCGIQNLIGHLGYGRRKLRGVAGKKIEKTKTRKFSTEKPHKQCNTNIFDDFEFFWDCNSDNPQYPVVNALEEYCAPESKLPKCIVTEKAFSFHHLTDKGNRCKSMAEKPYRFPPLG